MRCHERTQRMYPTRRKALRLNDQLMIDTQAQHQPKATGAKKENPIASHAHPCNPYNRLASRSRHTLRAHNFFCSLNNST